MTLSGYGGVMRWTAAILACVAACGPGDAPDTPIPDTYIDGDGPSITDGPTITPAGADVPLQPGIQQRSCKMWLLDSYLLRLYVIKS